MQIKEKIHQYFKFKTKEILALSEQAILDHNGLRGNHREKVLCQFFNEILPKRYSIDNGMVYGITGRSKETDIVIWDELNYPKLKMHGSNVFFAEAVKILIEVKTKWSMKEFKDIKNKTNSALNLSSNYREALNTRIENIEHNIWSLINNENLYDGRLLSPQKKGTVAIIYHGGKRFNIKKLSNNEIEDIENEYPDIMLFLEAGKVIYKDFIVDEEDPLFGKGSLNQINCKDTSLLIFTSLLIDLLVKRSEHIEPPLLLTDYLYDLFREQEITTIHFDITRPIAGSSKFF